MPSIYLDNAATSWPKPAQMIRAMTEFSDQIGANPGRSGHSRSVAAARVVYECRERLATLFNLSEPDRVIFGLNATDGLNLALHGLLQPGDHVITSSMEHNAVMRPLTSLSAQGVGFTVLPCKTDGTFDVAALYPAIRKNTKLIVFTHASNVCGTLLPICEIGEIAQSSGLLFLVDAAQTAGAVPIDMQADHIDLLAFTGHKALCGPMGTGGLLIGDRVDTSMLRTIRQGGTGSRSDSVEQPEFLPDKYESGTMNAIGLSGLNASVGWLMEQGIPSVREKEKILCSQLIQCLNTIAGVELYGTGDAEQQTGTVAFNIRGIDPAQTGLELDEQFGIQCRVGLHCSPAAHQTLGTFPNGSIRFSLGAFNTNEDVCNALQAVRSIASRAAAG